MEEKVEDDDEGGEGKVDKEIEEKTKVKNSKNLIQNKIKVLEKMEYNQYKKTRCVMLNS